MTKHIARIGLKLAVCIILLISIFAQSGGPFLTPGTGKLESISSKLPVTRVGTVAVATLLLAYVLITTSISVATKGHRAMTDFKTQVLKTARSTDSYASFYSIRSFLSVLSLLSAGSVLSIGSAGSIMSIGSTGSILSIGSVGSILSIGSAGSILGIGKAGRYPGKKH